MRKTWQITRSTGWAIVGLAALLVAVFGPLLAVPARAAGPNLELHNLDGLPYNDWMIFSRIQENPGYARDDLEKLYPIEFGVHDRATLRIKNSGTDPLTITNLTITTVNKYGKWELINKPTLPEIVPAASFFDLQVKFTATKFPNGASGGSGMPPDPANPGARIHRGQLTIQSDDGDEPSKTVQLAGYWQNISEGGENTEPKVYEMVALLGYTTTVVGPGQQMHRNGKVEAIGEEVLVPYWQLADPTKGVYARQIAAYHGNDKGQTATLSWFRQGSKTGGQFFTHAPSWGQTILPPKKPKTVGDPLVPAEATVKPGSTTFGFNVGNEYSDPKLNVVEGSHGDIQRGCGYNPPTQTCGHHVRFWPVRGRDGQLVPHTYIMAQDYAANNPYANYDYQDNVYLLSNIRPGAATGEPDKRVAIGRYDVGTGSNFTDSLGQTWQPDTGKFSPASMPNEDPNNEEILGTNDDKMYESYRGRVGGPGKTAQWNFPVGGGQQIVDVRFHFAERFHNSAGLRLFDVTAEGQLVIDDLDIFEATRGKNAALVIEAPGIVVTDGSLTLSLVASVDNPALAGVEILRSTLTAPPTPTAPLTPTTTPTLAPTPVGNQPRAWIPFAAR
jgi:hypothetical protein